MKLRERMNIQNWLDPLRVSITWERQRCIFSRPLVRELGQLVHQGDLLDPYFTGLPRMTLENETPDRQMSLLHELCCGPFQTNRVPEYIQSLVHLRNQAVQAQNIQHYHQLREDLLDEHPVECWYFDQRNAPVDWPPQLPWQPIRILTVPGLPAKYKSNANNANRHTVVLAYVPSCVPPQHPDKNWDLVVPAPSQHSPPLQRLQMWCCGDRRHNHCKTGARTSFPEVHVMTAVAIGCVHAYNRQWLKSSHRRLNVLDPSLPNHMTAELVGDRHQ